MNDNLENRIMQKMNNAKEIAIKKQEYMALIAEETSLQAIEYLNERFELVKGRTKLTKKLQENIETSIASADEFSFPINSQIMLLLGLEKLNVDDAKNIMDFMKRDSAVKNDEPENQTVTPEPDNGMSKDEIAQQKRYHEIFQKLKRIAETEESHD